MPDLRRISGLAIVFIVVLRMTIGWQLLYEGLWKLDTQDTSTPWSAEGYLKNARGPLRPFFLWLTGDPYELKWLDYETVSARWDRWAKAFRRHHPDLTREQKERLDHLLNGPPDFRAILRQWPEGLELGGSLARVIEYDPERDRLMIDGELHMTAVEKQALLRELNKVVARRRAEADAKPVLAPVPGEEVQRPVAESLAQLEGAAEALRQALDRAYQRAQRLSIKERARALLKGDPERATLIYEQHKGTTDYKRIGQIDLYRKLLNRYERKLRGAEVDFEFEHLEKLGYPGYGTLADLRAEVVGPIKALDEELKREARALLTAEQRARGPVSLPMTRMEWVDQLTMWSLVVLGVLLLAGLFSRLGAIGAALLLLSFYLAMPPWLGYVDLDSLPGTEHAYIVNKNLIEVFALLSIAAMPTGKWFGIDAIISVLFGGRRRRKRASARPSGSSGASRTLGGEATEAAGKQAAPAGSGSSSAQSKQSKS